MKEEDEGEGKKKRKRKKRKKKKKKKYNFSLTIVLLVLFVWPWRIAGPCGCTFVICDLHCTKPRTFSLCTIFLENIVQKGCSRSRPNKSKFWKKQNLKKWINKMYLYMDIEPSSYCLNPNKRYVAYIVNILHHSNLSSVLQYLQAIHKHVVSVQLKAKTWKCDLEIFTAFLEIFFVFYANNTTISRVESTFHESFCK